MSIAEKLTLIAENEEKVFEAGGLAYSPQETVSGEIVSIDDISPIEHDVDVKVASKNLIDISKWTCRNCTYSDGVFTCNIGEGNQYAEIYTTSTALKNILLQNRGKSITFSIAETLNDRHMAIVIYGTTTEGKNVSIAPFLANTNAISAVIREDFVSITSIALRFNWKSSNTYTDTTTTVSNLQLEIGETATPYTPYVPDLSAVTVKTQGKNLFNNDTSLMKQVSYIGSSGTENKRYGYEIHLPIGTYTIRSIPKAPLTTEHYIYGSVVDENNVAKQSVTTVMNTTLRTVTFNIEKGDMLKIYEGDGSIGLSMTKQRFDDVNIQLEEGTEATDYEPYIEPISYPVATDGTVEGVKSIYPNMTITTDTQGALIDCTYKQEAKKVKEKLTDLIISLGGVL